MSYTALYRKWRPQDFDSLVGQEHIVKTLKNQIILNRIAHAYLFCGTRGTGKTSMAKLFAKAINCMDLHDGEPCNKCASCLNIIEGKSMNVIEIDAASNNGVDNIREIREDVKYLPTEGQYKVYIIDEVHMLSIGAFNALLKTLEEPPTHVIFILATTDPQKIPVTILSRCQRYDFKRISQQDIFEALSRYMVAESIDIEPKAIKYIASVSDGAMRDALNILDQCIAFYYGEKITVEKVAETIGAVDSEVFYKLFNSLIKKDSFECMQIVDEIITNGRDIRQFITDLIVHLRNVLIVKSSDKTESILSLSDEMIEKLRLQVKDVSASEIIAYIQEFSDLESKLKYASNTRILVEVLLIKLCREQVQVSSDDYEAINNKIRRLENAVANGIKVVQTTQIATEKRRVEEKPKPKPKAVPADLKEAIKVWQEIKGQYITAPQKAYLTDSQAGYLDDGIFYIKIDSEPRKARIDAIIDEITKKIEDKTGKSFTVRTILAEKFDERYNMIYGNENETNEDKWNISGLPEGVVTEEE